MTLVHAETGEVLTDADVIEEFTRDEAEAFVGRINASLHITGEMVIEAYQRRIWKALGYPTWDEFSQDRMGGESMTPAARAVLAVGLRQAGMSLRAIRSVTGGSRNTVAKQVAHIEPPAEITGRDGKSYSPTQPERGASTREGEEGGAAEPSPDDDPHPPLPAPGDVDDSDAPATLPPSPGADHPSRMPQAALDELLPDETADLEEASYQASVSRAISSVRSQLLSFDAADLAVRADAENWERLNALVASVNDWAEQLTSARPVGLRVINGGMQ